MSEWITLQAKDGHDLDGYVARPQGEPVGALVLIQEIFGVNKHIRSVADGYAKDGFLVVAPALFDRYEKKVDLTYEGEDQKHAYELYPKLALEPALLDIAAAYEYARTTGKKIGVLGFCIGGLLSWLSSTRAPQLGTAPACCVGYYPGGVGKFAQEQPTCPVLLNFGAEDSHIGVDQIDAVRSAHPDVEVVVYEGAGHGFNCDMRSDYNAAAAKIARERSLAFLKKHIV